MTILNRTRAAWRAFTSRPAAARGYDAAKAGRLMADWFASATSSDAETRRSYRRLLDRSRDLERNNDYQRGFLLSVERNVVGAIRADLRMDCGEFSAGAKGAPPKWMPDRQASSIIEAAWAEWGKKGTCTVCGRHSWRDVKRIAVRALARDGNIIARKITGPASRNRFGFALQLWEIDHLDLEMFRQLAGGGEIRFGIESDADQRVIAYHLRVKHPGDTIAGSYQTIRITAAEVYHLFLAERAEQSIGIPWIVSAITRLRQLGAFEEAATIAARLGASKVGFFKRTAGQEEEFKGERDPNGRFIMDASPGTFEELPEGLDLASWNPEYPNIETGDFRKAMLRGVGTSVGVSYNTLGNDMESVNFSSARVGLFEEREGWKAIQTFCVENFWEPVFSDFLAFSILSGAINLPIAKLAKFDRPVFKARRWPFIDPLKELEAAKTGIALRVTSRRQFIEENGGDVEDVFHDNLDDETLAENIGLSLAPADVAPETVSTFSTTDTGAPADGTDPAAPATGKKTKGARTAPALPTAKEIAAEVIRQTPPAAPVQREPQTTVNIPAPVVNIPAPIVNVHVPEQREQPAPIIQVNVPQQPAPIVHVAVPEAPAPVVNVAVPAQPAPVVNVTVPKMNATLTLARDNEGNLSGGTITP